MIKLLRRTQLILALLFVSVLYGTMGSQFPWRHSLKATIPVSPTKTTISNKSAQPAVTPPFVNTAVSSFWNLPHEQVWPALSRHFTFKIDPTQHAVRTQIKSYLENRDYLNMILRNSRPYIYDVIQQAKQDHIPEDLALVPFVESDYNPFGRASTGANGLWQLMPGTASGYGLRINWWYDGRRSIPDSTQAALNYLGYLHGEFNNWYLALAAYDAGDGTISAAIRYNREHGRPTDFWSLPLPKETREYVPKLLALSEIIQNPKKYHVNLPNVPNEPYFQKVQIKSSTTLTAIAKLSGTNINTILALNPGYRRFKIPDKTYPLLLPTNQIKIFETNLSKTPATQLAAATVPNFSHLPNVKYQVKSGDTLSRIAHSNHIKITALKNANHLTKALVKPGQTLVIPQKNSKEAVLASNNILVPPLKHSTSIISEDNMPGPKPVNYTFEKGDSLKKIGREYHVSPDDLWFWNKMQGVPKPGEQLLVWVNPKHAHPSTQTHHHSEIHNSETFTNAHSLNVSYQMNLNT